MSGVYLVELESDFKTYPKKESAFSPNKMYPEYPWSEETLSLEENQVYELVRKCFYIAGYDRDNYGNKNWNPLGRIIKRGDTVLIKPNWVQNRNKNDKADDNLACLVTNPSVIRAIVDYVVIALGGEGKIVIGDAPMQSCDLQNLFQQVGYDTLFEFYEEQQINIEIQDFRKYSTVQKAKGVLSSPIMNENNVGSICVDLGAFSMHSEKDDAEPIYKVTDYTQEMTAKYHSKGIHEYEINKMSLEADVIINVPKPKTHRLAGMTAAVKNFVGVTYEKACLPHRIEGDKENGGDAYLKKSVWKRKMHFFDEKRTHYSANGNYFRSKFFDILMKACYVIGTLVTKDPYRIGSWYGNDTIWRTAVDLNFILQYADKNGVINNSQQRKILTIADMLICGQKNGPVSPTPKSLGLIMMSENLLLFDRVMCEIMNFDYKQLPIFMHPETYKRFGYRSEESLLDELIYQEKNNYIEKRKISEFVPSIKWKFEPHDCWKGYIEK